MKNLTLHAVLVSVVATGLVGCGGKSKAKPTTVEAPAADTSRQPSETTPVDTATSSTDLPATPAAVSLATVIGFEFDSSTLSDDARDKLQQNADWLREDPARTLVIEGHTDQTGTDEYNLALGERRAAAAKDYLTSLGVAASRLRTLSYGEERPQCAGSDESCWSRNRRAHFLVTGRTNAG